MSCGCSQLKQIFVLSLIEETIEHVWRFTIKERIPVKEAYQTKRPRMFWAALGIIITRTAATIYNPARMSKTDSIFMAQYLALSGLAGA